MEVKIIGVLGIPLVKQGDDLARLIVEAAREHGVGIAQGDILVVAQKVVSKAEGRIVRLDEVEPSTFAHIVTSVMDRKDPRHVEVVLRETSRIIRMKDGHLIMETNQGYVCANAGVDVSNVSGGDVVSLLPKDPDRSAQMIREGIRGLTGVDVAVIVSDTFGRPWRLGHVNFALGVAGMEPFIDYRGQTDMLGYRLVVTRMAVADELAAAAELAMGKSSGVPVVIIRGFPYPEGEGWGREMIRPLEQDLFR